MFDRFVIPIECPWKQNFDIIIIFASVISVFSQGYYSAFGNPTDQLSGMIETLTEILFTIDMLFCFCQEYNDTETYKLISDLKQIAKNYAKGKFIFDFLAIFPFRVVLRGSVSPLELSGKDRLFKVLKLLRVPRLVELLNVDRVKKVVKVHYQKQLENNLAKQKDSENYPILKALRIVTFYKAVRLMMIIFSGSYFLGIFWYIFIHDIQSPWPVNPNDLSQGYLDTFLSKFLDQGCPLANTAAEESCVRDHWRVLV